MKELQEIINNKVQSMVDDGTIVSVIEKSIEKSVTKAIEDQLEPYGSITKSIKGAMDEGLQINLKDLPFETYNQQMLVAVKAKLGSFFSEMASEKFLGELESLLEPAPKEMDIHDLVNRIVAFWKTDDYDESRNMDEYASVELEHENNRCHTLKMWKKKDESFGSISSGLQLFLIHGKIRINHNHKYNPTCISDETALIFKLYAAGTKIIGLDDFNEHNCELALNDFDC